MRPEKLDVGVAEALELPITPYTVDGYRFGQRVRSRLVLWARHLGDDVIAEPGTEVRAIGDGVIVWSEVRAGSEQKRNWGGLVVVAHRHKETHELFFSLYGHMKQIVGPVMRKVQKGEVVGQVAEGFSPDNGWWKLPHLHFGLYAGPWTERVLPGYARPGERRTKFSWWRNPREFIEGYNEA